MRAFNVSIGNLTADQLAGNTPLLGGSGCVTWHSMEETTGSASAEYGLSSNEGFDQPLMYVSLSPGQSTRDYIGLHAVPFIGGLWLNVSSGSIAGAILGYTDHVCEDVLSAHAAILQLEGAAALKALGELGGP